MKGYKSILSTRILEATLLQEAEENGVKIDCIPFIDIQYKSITDIHQQLSQLSPRDIFIFTSQHAVNAAFEIVKDLNNATYCISGATRQALEQSLLTIEASADYAADLVKLMEMDENRNYILFCGNKRMPTIPRFLQQQGLHLLEVICYDNFASPHKVLPFYEGVMFYSPSGVESYFTLNQAAQHQKYYCIGTTTANAVGKYSKGNIIVAEKPGIPEMIQKIKG